MAIASAGGIAGTLVGTVLPLLPPYLPVAAMIALFLQKFGVFIILAIATAVISPAFGEPADSARVTWGEIQWIVDLAARGEWNVIWSDYRLSAVAFLTGTGFAAYYFMSALRKGLLNFAFKRLFTGVLVAVLIAPLPLFVQKVYHVPFDPDVASEIVRRPWLPTEEIMLRSGGSRLGYTLATKDGWYLILAERDRTVEYFPTVEIVGRRVCAMEEQEYRLPAVPVGGSALPNPRICELPPPTVAAASTTTTTTTTRGVSPG